MRANWFAAGVAERQSVVRVAVKIQKTVVVGPVVRLTQRQKVGGIGGSTVFPMDPMVDLEASSGPASRHHTTAVPSEHDPAEAVGDDAGLAPDIDLSLIHI